MLDSKGTLAYPVAELHGVRFEFPKSIERLTWICSFIEAALRPRDQCLMWVTGWGVWQSSENWHLYYRLRGSYGDSRLIEEAPGHLFLPYEQPDLVSFLQIVGISGWDAHVLASNGYGRAVLSHDGWLEFGMEDPLERDRLRREATNAGLTQLTNRAFNAA